jgi:hypothetical protein
MAPERVDGEFTFGGQEHFYLETHAAWAEAGEDGAVTVNSSSTQHPSEIQTIVAEVLHVPRNKVVVQAPRMGGGFGGKETQGNAWAAYVALAAVKTGRPVRVQLDRDVDMALTGKRHPFHAKFSVGHDRDGKLLAAHIELTSDGGWSLDLSQPIHGPGAVSRGQRLLSARGAFHGPGGEDEHDVEHGVSRVWRTAGHARDRGDRGPRGARAAGWRRRWCASGIFTTAPARRTGRITARTSVTTGCRRSGRRRKRSRNFAERRDPRWRRGMRRTRG